VRVTENATGADITGKVLAQIILDLDAPKLEVFPAPLLMELIRVNDQLMLGFYEKFFHQAMRAFIDYQQLIESQFKQGGVLPAMFPPLSAWTQAMTTPFGTGQVKVSEPSPPYPQTPVDDVASTLADLQRQVLRLQAQLAKSRKPGRPKPRAKRPRNG
jgi:polyhydroxyalkanoate synthesis regulator protein